MKELANSAFACKSIVIGGKAMIEASAPVRISCVGSLETAATASDTIRGWSP